MNAKSAEPAKAIVLCVVGALCVLRSGVARAQEAERPAGPTRVAILQAEERRAPMPRDLAVIRSGLHTGDAQTTRIAVRALGRLERPALIADIVPSLRHPLPEVRSEAANALAQALHKATDAANREAALTALLSRLKVEADANVRGAISEALGRVAATPEQAQRVDEVLTDEAHATNSEVRLGAARAFEILGRVHRQDPPLSEAAIAALRSMVAIAPARPGAAVDPARDVRVRRVALEALVGVEGVDDATLARAMADPDPQVRRLAVRAIGTRAGAADLFSRALTDPSAIVRIETLRAARSRPADAACAAAVLGTGDEETHVALVAIDALAPCGGSADAVAILAQAIADPVAVAKPRAWHRAAHALVALATAAPERVRPALAGFARAPIWQLRMYAARAAAAIADRQALDTLAADDDDNVREAAVDGLTKVADREADAVYIGELGRKGYQVVRAAAAALNGTSDPAAAPALAAALKRLVDEGRDNSHDARAAIEKTLAALGAPVHPHPAAFRPLAAEVTAQDLRRFAAPRARVTIHDVGTFELVLFTGEAPAAVVRFAHLAEAGYYNGLTIHRVVPNFVVQGGSPGANEYIGDAAFMPDEVGLWPHVRGAVGISTRGHDTGDAQFFVDLVDNPRLNHEYTVFAQVLNGIDVVDRILEGDVVDRIEIVAN
jgi:cyclophilin family peptidyl-prolyl cis-trans isomerase/HEAT repeat protein